MPESSLLCARNLQVYKILAASLHSNPGALVSLPKRALITFNLPSSPFFHFRFFLLFTKTRKDAAESKMKDYDRCVRNKGGRKSEPQREQQIQGGEIIVAKMLGFPLTVSLSLEREG